MDYNTDIDKSLIYPHHLGTGVEYGMEITVGSTHCHLVAGLEGEYVG